MTLSASSQAYVSAPAINHHWHKVVYDPSKGQNHSTLHAACKSAGFDINREPPTHDRSGRSFYADPDGATIFVTGDEAAKLQSSGYNIAQGRHP